jgi:hypothetical protein
MAASGLQATTSTQLVCPLQVCCGVCRHRWGRSTCFGWTDGWLQQQQQQHLTTLEPATSPAAAQYSNCGSSRGSCTSMCRQPPARPPTHPPTWVLRSQNLTVVSPLPLARRRPSGLKFTDSTASAAGSSRVSRSAGACGSVGAVGEPGDADSRVTHVQRQQQWQGGRTCMPRHAGCAPGHRPDLEHRLWLVHHPQYRLNRHLQGGQERRA